MEGSRRQQPSRPDSHGRTAENPVQIPKRGWRDIFLRTKEGIQRDNVSMIAGGTAFFVLLGLVPALAALISIYGLVSNPADIQAQFANFARAIPAEASKLLEDQMTRIARQPNTAGIAAMVSILLALWGAAAGMKTVMNALNIIYHEEEKRGYIKVTAIALGLTVVLVAMGVVAVGVIVAAPPILTHLGLGSAARTAAWILRWVLLLGLALGGLAILYRYGPSRERPRWQWVSPGAVAATVLWIAGSVLFSIYAQHFSSYNKTYGSLAAVIVLMMWLYISAFALLVGAELNAETEHQTAEDSTTGHPLPAGRRGAHVADTLGEER